MPLTFVFRDSTNSIDAVTLDASLSEKHAGDVDVPEHPVETGANISDHVRKKPEALSVDGILTDYPLESSRGDFKFVAASGQTPGPGRARAMYEKLEAMRDSGTVIEVFASTKNYPNMLIRSLNRTHDKSTSGAFKFTAQLTEIRMAESQLVPVKRTKVNAAKPKVSGGKQTGTKADAPTKNKSWIAGAVDSAVGREGVGGPDQALAAKKKALAEKAKVKAVPEQLKKKRVR